MSFKLVAFDWNGTVLDDIEAGVTAESATRVHFGFKETNIDEIRRHFQIPIRQYWINAGLKAEFFDQHTDEINRIYHFHYEPLEKKSNLRPNTIEILKWLTVQNIECIIFSNHIVSHIEEQLKRLGAHEYFSKFLARSSKLDVTHHSKTFKDLLLTEYVKEKGLNPGEVVVVGDTFEEIEIGKRFGYCSVALTEGWQSEERLKAAKPDYLIHDMIELKNIIQNKKA